MFPKQLQKMNALFDDQFYWGYLLQIFNKICQLWVLRMCFSEFYQDTFLYMEFLLGYLYGRTYYDQFSNKHMHTEAVFHLNARLNLPLSFIEILT